MVDNETQDPMDGTEMSEDGVDASSSLVSINRQGLEESFGVDHTWHRSQHFALISVPKGRKAAASLIYLWLVFTVAFDGILQFGLRNSYNARVFSQVADFVVEQWGVRPLQIEHFPSGGKTIRYLLSFGMMDLRHICMLLRGWVKLARGLGCRVLCPADVFRSPFPITITGTPMHLATTTIERIINKWAFVCKVSELCWVTLDNNICTDKIEGLLELAGHGESPFSLDTKEIDYPFDIQGFKLRLLRRSLCLVCGDDDHVQMDCPVK